MVSPPPGLPILGLEGAPQGAEPPFPGQVCCSQQRPSGSSSEPRKPEKELYYCTVAALYIPGTVLGQGSC